MEMPREVRSGVKKNEHASKTQKEFDLDRKRDDPTVLEINSLKEEGFDKKQISFYNTDELDTLWRIVPSKSIFEWVSDGEVQITLLKDPDNPVKYWTRLLKDKS